MMLLHRWAVAGVLGALSWTAWSAAQSSSPAKNAALAAKAQAGQKAAPAPDRAAPNIVQPDDGPPPDQAQQPDQALPLDQTVPPEPATPLPDPLAEEEAPAPVLVTPPAATTAATSDGEPASTPAARPVPAAEPVLVASTPEQRQLQKDADRLLQLVKELKVEVDKAGSNTLSLEAVRKADEVQRLTKSLKERVKGWSQPTQSR